MKALIFFVLILSETEWVTVNADKKMDNLANDLIKDYTSFMIPDNVTVTIGLSIKYIEFDQTRNILSIKAWERYRWRDSRLTWDPAEYGGTTQIRIPAALIWTPDITLANAYMNSHQRIDVNVIVNHEGDVMWIPASTMSVLCSNDDHKDDGDSSDSDNDDDNDGGTRRNCSLKFLSWTYDGFLLALSNDSQPVEISLEGQGSSGLKIASVLATVNTVNYACCPEPYPDYTVKLKIKS